VRQILRHLVNWFIGETFAPTANLEKFPMQGSEKPAFDVRQVSELMSFARPDVKSLLGKITSVSLTSGETEAKSIKIAVIKFH
jgi:hypothetical protein